MRKIGEHAVVLGAGMGGLLAARVLAEAYELVTVIERDALPADRESRRGVPQGRHVHALLPSGSNALDELLPGLTGELAGSGALLGKALEEVRFFVGGHELDRVSTGEHVVLASRPFIEAHVRQRTQHLPGVEIIDRADAVGLAVSDGGDRLTGARILRRADGSAEEVLPADLVVDAMGRSGRTPAWLATLGYPRPDEQKLRISLAYATRHLRLPPDALGGDQAVIIGPRPGRPRSLVLLAQEDDRWILSLAGYGSHRPPSDPEGFLAFAATVAPPEVLTAIQAAQTLDDIATYQYPANQRRRYELLDRFPAGLLVFGDAIASFNPVYGQGMSVAAQEALELRRCLEQGDHELARRFFSAAAQVVEPAWQLAAGNDLGLPEVTGHRPLKTRLFGAYVRRLQAAAARDPVVAEAFLRVVALLDPPSRLLSAPIALRALRHGHHPRRSAAAHPASERQPRVPDR